LLVSVRSAEEARAAYQGGAHVIDVKEPNRGSLGAAPAAVLQHVAAAIGGARLLSAALGELADFAPPTTAALVGYTFAKLGLAHCANGSRWPSAWQAALSQLPPWVTPVAVAYADHQSAGAPEPSDVCTVGHRLGCKALLIDTFDKTRGGTLDVLDLGALQQVLQRARALEMQIVLAGSLKLNDLGEALELRPHYLAVRGAVCRGSRKGILDQRLVEQWVQSLMAVPAT
jgi:uncharacterized protein (UPF0264 family)